MVQRADQANLTNGIVLDIGHNLGNHSMKTTSLNTKNYILIVWGIALLALSGLAQTAPEIPPGLLAEFKQMSPAQQRALAKQYGVDITDLVEAAAAKPAQVLAEPAAPIKQVDLAEDEEKEAPDKAAPAQAVDMEAPAEALEIAPELKRFGAQIFDAEVTTFAPVDNVPVPPGYLLGVGDNISILLYGNLQLQSELVINREGSINFPQLGPIALAGLPWIEARKVIEARVKQQLIGTNVVASLGRLRSINVFMAGEVKVPGNYSVSGLTTITQAIYTAGGISPVGSYRDIQVKRSGQTVATFDLYDLLLKGSLDKDIRLQTNDVVFVPPTSAMASIQGQVLRPAIFEFRSNETIEDLLNMAGGLLSRAYTSQALLQRYVPGADLPTLNNLDLTLKETLSSELFDGDIITVEEMATRMQNPITLIGEVERPGVVAWMPGVRISTFIKNIDGDVKESADLAISLVIRRKNFRLDIEVLPFNLGSAIAEPGGDADLLLEPYDQVLVFSLTEKPGEDRLTMLKPVVRKLVQQTLGSEWPLTVTLKGAIETTGDYPLAAGQTVSSLLALAGGSGYLKFFVDLDVALILRKDESLVDIKVIPFSLEAALENPGSELDPILKPLDEVLILDLVTGEGSNRSELLADVNAKLRNEATAAREAEIITIQGKVRMPGDYPILASGELNYLIDLAGGFAEGAYVDQAEVSRRFITADKKEKIELLEVDLASVSDMGSFQLKPRDIVRVNTIPGWQQEQNVTLSGEVVFPGIYAIENGETLASVLNRAGGLTDQAFPEAAIFINQVAKEQQLTQAETIVQRLESELATDAAIEEEGEGDATTEASGLKKSVLAAIDGRIVIDIKSILKGSKKANIELQDGDSLHIPRLNRTVSVAGEVFHPGTFLIDEGSSKSDFIALAGQETRYADKKRTYVIKADGSVTPARGGGMWLSGFSRKGGIEAGDTIVVPTNLDYEQPLNRINAVTSIVFQSMASIAAFFNMSN